MEARDNKFNKDFIVPSSMSLHDQPSFSERDPYSCALTTVTAAQIFQRLRLRCACRLDRSMSFVLSIHLSNVRLETMSILQLPQVIMGFISHICSISNKLDVPSSTSGMALMQILSTIKHACIPTALHHLAVRSN